MLVTFKKKRQNDTNETNFCVEVDMLIWFYGQIKIIHKRLLRQDLELLITSTGFPFIIVHAKIGANPK